MIFKIRSPPFKYLFSLATPQVYFPFSDNKLPFDREFRDSPISRKSSGFWDSSPKPSKTSPPLQAKVEIPPPIREEPKESVVQKVAPQVKEGSPLDVNMSVAGTPLQQAPPIDEKEINVKFTPEPLNFGILAPKGFSEPNSTNEHKPSIVQKQEQPVNTVVMSNIGLNRYLTRIYVTSGSALFLTLASSYACVAFPGLNQFADLLLAGGGILSFLSFQRAQGIKPKFFEEKLKGDTIYRTQNDPMRLAIFGVGCIAMGLSASPLFMAVHEVSPSILPLTMGVTAAIFGGASLTGLLMPRTMMLGYGSALTGGLFGLIGLNASGVLAAKFLGITAFANTLTTFESYIGIGIFTTMIIYDTHQAIKRYEKGDADHLGMSIQILLDIWNLIITIAKEIAKAKAKQAQNKNK